MATTNAQFMPDLWSIELLEKYKQSMLDQLVGRRPKRSKAAQMLRDAALGHPEYPEQAIFEQTPREMTATEVRMRNEMYTHQLDSYRYAAVSWAEFSNSKRKS